MKNYQEPFCYHDGRNIVGKEFAQHNDVFPLYTSPPQRKTRHVSYVCPQCHYSLDERDPLTDEQMREANAANARVIAAAPDLLNACMRALLLLSDPEADENEADRVTLVLVDALRLAGSLDSKLELT